MLDPEIVRYIEYLQRTLTDTESAEYFDLAREKEWIASRPQSLQRLLERYGDHGAGIAEEYEREALQFESPFKLDSFHATSVFRGILRKVQEVCITLKMNPKRPVILAPNTSLGLTPLARPSDGEHLLFSGLGTMAFCNYWAKAYARLLHDFSRSALPLTLDQADLPSLARRFPEHIKLIARLLLYYGHFGTLLGFGDLPIEMEYDGLRLQLLEAMEMFSIAHEIGHFVAEEIRPRGHSSLGRDEAHSLEFFCDQYGQAVCRWYGAENSRWLCFNATGAILYLHSAYLSINASRKLAGSGDEHQSQSHPNIIDRIESLVAEAIARVPEDQQEGVRAYLAEILAVTKFIETEIAVLIRPAP